MIKNSCLAIIVLPVVFLFPAITIAQRLSPGDNLSPATQIRANNPLLSRSDSIVDRAARKYFKDSGAVSLVIGISDHGHRQYYGYARTNPAGPLPDSNTLFEIGSITKTFTSWLLADAVISQRTALDSPAKKWLPPGLLLTKDGKDITLLQLSNHSSGLPRMMNNYTMVPGFNAYNPYKTYTKQFLLDYLAKNGPLADPGSRYEYSNIAPAVLALALENIYKTSYARLVAEKIFVPLKMNRSFLVVPHALLPDLVDGHSATGALTPHWDFDCMAPIGGIKSTTHDMLNYLEAQLNDKNSAFALTHRPTFKVNDLLSVGLAWHIYNFGGDAGKIIWHNGGTGGFSSFAGFNEDKDIAIIAMANSGMLGAMDPVGGGILKQL